VTGPASPPSPGDARPGRRARLGVGLGLVLVAISPGLGASLGRDGESWRAEEVEAARDVDPALDRHEVEALPFGPWDGTLRGGEVAWLRVRLRNLESVPVHQVLEIPHAGLDEVRFVLPSEVGEQSFEAGLSVPLAARALRRPLPAAPLSLAPGQSTWALVRVHDGQPSPVELFVYTRAGWEAHLRASSTLVGLFFGFALLAILWNLAQYLIGGERSTLDYALYVLSFTLYVAWWLDGEILYLAAVGPRAFELGALVLLGLIGLSVLRFFRSFLDTATTDPAQDRHLRWARVLPPLPLLAWSLGLRAATPKVAAAVSLLTLLVLARVLIRALRRDLVRTRYFALAWGAWGLLAAGYPLATAGLHSSTLLIQHGPRLAFLVEVALLGLALADRLHRLDLERRHALERELEESRHAARLGETFARYVPRQFLSLLGKQSILDVRRGDAVDLELSVLFSDIRGFTTMAEAMGTEQTFRFIDGYLGIMEPALASRGGFINDIFGDGIMALFDGGADDAVGGALAMLDGLDQLNARRAAQGLEPLAMGIGLHTGRLMLGTIGGETRLDCTVVGDPANLAARVEGMTSMYGAALLMSGDTRTALSDPGALRLRRLDRVQAKGKGAIIDVWEILDGERGARRAQKEAVSTDYEAALDAYLAGRFEQARDGFARCVQAAPLDPASRVLLERSERLVAEPPSDWPGHTRLMSK
jgi:class 3 adenylate cyclase